MKKRTINSVLILFALVFYFSFIISAVGEVCHVTDRASCSNPGEVIVLGLSSGTNAHGELGNSTNYNTVLCCNLPNSTLTCGGTNKILGLSSDTNAHAENPDQTNYATDVCYSDLECVSTSNSCGDSGAPDHFLTMVTLSNPTNAHLGASGNFPSINICCTSPSIVNPNCGNGIIDPGEQCEGSDFGALTCSSFDSHTGGSLFCNPNTCQIITSGCTGGNLVPGICGDGVININEQCEGSDFGGLGCTDFDGFPSGSLSCNGCQIDTSSCTPFIQTNAFWSLNGNTPISTLDVTIGITTVKLVLQNSGLSQGTNVSFDIKEDDLVLNDNIRTENASIDSNGTAVANWTITQADLDSATDGILNEDFDDMTFFFTANGDTSNILDITIVGSADACSDIVICSDYPDEASCENDDALCQVAQDSVPSNVDCDDDFRDCRCIFDEDTNSCESGFDQNDDGSPPPVGTCIFVSNTTDTCDDGFLSYSWVAGWSGAIEDRPAECVDGSRTIECPAEIQLPFFGVYNFIVIILIIAFIYTILILRRKELD